MSIARLFDSAVKYNGETDLAPIALVGVTPMVFVTHAQSGIKTMDQAIAKSKREPNRLSFASSGVGTPLHVSGELINMMAGATFLHVPYRGAAQKVQDLLGGNIDFSVSVLSVRLAAHRVGQDDSAGRNDRSTLAGRRWCMATSTRAPGR